MDFMSQAECADKLLEAVRLFLNYSVQNYIERGIIKAHEKNVLMRELLGRIAQSVQEYNHPFNDSATAPTCFSFE